MWFATKVALSLLWGIPWAAVGLLLCATIILSPAGLLCLSIAGYPLACVMRTKVTDATYKAFEYKHRDRPLESEVEPPWIV